MNTYEAILIHPDVTGGRVSGNLQIKTNGIFFESGVIKYHIGFTSLSITVGGAANRFIFFLDTSINSISIYTADKSILKDSILVSNNKFKQEIKKSKSALNGPFRGIIIALIIIGFFIGSLYVLKDKMVEGIASQLPISWEQKAGDKLFNTLSLQYHFIKNDTLKNEFIKVAKPLFNQIEKEGYEVDLYFVKDPTINAFALPGGKVIIQTGLIENAKSWEEVMGVLSHELSHVTRRHHLRGIINNLGIFAILSATLGDVSAIAGTFINMGGELASLSNSRDFEIEADETGRQYLVNAKINPAGLLSFFKTLEKEEKTILDSTAVKDIDLSFLSTHPDTKTRIKKLKEKQKEDKTPYPVLPNTFNDFKAKLLKIK
ncbi:M48 family metallopeptidase [Flavobacterium davisii]|uniref:M48 family metallopeptidase n=1 Tax=Flavobacterium columnare TaxID=996 RepID=A0A8G0P5D9_9FLAO|nr:M48 family metallopeptidase [Flavobacterium davisii]QYS87917.1 M48 family metallopeptidase [Flavobacterium davisii]